MTSRQSEARNVPVKLTWTLLHLKLSVGQKEDSANWKDNRDVVDSTSAMENVGISW